MDLQQLYLLTQRYRVQLQGVTAAGDDRLLALGGLSGPVGGVAAAGGLPTAPSTVSASGVGGQKELLPLLAHTAVDECRAAFGSFSAMLASGGGGGNGSGANANALLAHCLERFYADALLAAASARCAPPPPQTQPQPQPLTLSLPPAPYSQVPVSVPVSVPVPHSVRSPLALPGPVPMLLPALAAEPNANQTLGLGLIQYLSALCAGCAQSHDQRVEATKLQQMAQELESLGFAGHSHSSPLNLSLNPSSSTPSTTAGSAPYGSEKLGSRSDIRVHRDFEDVREQHDVARKKEAALLAAATPSSPHKIAHSTQTFNKTLPSISEYSTVYKK